MAMIPHCGVGTSSSSTHSPLEAEEHAAHGQVGAGLWCRGWVGVGEGVGVGGWEGGGVTAVTR